VSGKRKGYLPSGNRGPPFDYYFTCRNGFSIKRICPLQNYCTKIYPLMKFCLTNLTKLTEYAVSLAGSVFILVRVVVRFLTKLTT
jgi:hypothetical protein